ncbi:MAG: hypothetical protein AUI47_05830 [Acidobacteria bacterium 13_1_40CM_2_68_5]|nr:MAG: hypothetical protein AUI47_05830 [Acidobacteria bacterium 13_1_40CM_2_68_5]
MKRSLVVSMALAIGLGLASARAEEAAKPDAGKVEKGQKVYADKHCSMCHSIAGKGNPKTPLDGVGSKMSADDLKKYIINPKSVKPDSKMMANPNLPAEELDALIVYLKTLTKK